MDVMRGLGVVLAVAAIVVLAGCGDDAGDDAGETTTKTITSEFLAIPEERLHGEAYTPGSGGFIETPQARSGEKVPEIKRAPGSGESVFAGIHRDAYLRARAACGAVSRRNLARRVGADSTIRFVIAGEYAARVRPALWVPAFEGCAVGMR
jgi:hypothetical protein